MTTIDRSAIDALHRIEQQRKARENTMRNALTILSRSKSDDFPNLDACTRFVRAIAREGLGRETE